MTRFVGGSLQGEFMTRVRDLDPARCLVVPVDIGKWSAMALVADHFGEVIVEAFQFPLTETGVADSAGGHRPGRSGPPRPDLPSGDRSHRPLSPHLGVPPVRRRARGGASSTRPRSKKPAPSSCCGPSSPTQRDLGAMAELMVRGGGRPVPGPQRRPGRPARPGWRHRRRKLAAHQALANQVQSQLDLVFPGLAGCFADLLGAKAGRVILADICDPDRICRLGANGFGPSWPAEACASAGPRPPRSSTRPEPPCASPEAERTVLGTVLSADVALLSTLEAELARAESALAQILPATPAAILTSLPGIGVVRASSLRGRHRRPLALPQRRGRLQSLRSGPHRIRLSRPTTPPRPTHQPRRLSLLRQAIIELGKGLTGHHHDFAAYRRRLIDQDKKTPAVAAVAAGRRAHRLAFAMLRSQTPFDPARWQDSITNQPTRTRARRPKQTTTKQSDPATPPDRSRATPRTRRQGPGKTSP